MKKIVMFGHFGSGNHGSEAIIKGTKKIINNCDRNVSIKVETRRPEEDIKYNTLNIDECIKYKENTLSKIINKIFRHPDFNYRFKEIFTHDERIEKEFYDFYQENYSNI